MVRLAQDSRGNFRARKRLPEDVRAEYGRRHGAQHEAKFSAPATTSKQTATKLFGEWLATVEGRIGAIRAERDGTGQSLTPMEARKLAGDWYYWWSARHVRATQRQLDDWRDQVHEAFGSAGLSQQEFEALDPDELWSEREDVRAEVRPVLADIGETAQFLAAKQLALTNAARDLFLDNLYGDLAAALDLLRRRGAGDYSPDKYAERFPKHTPAADTGVTPWQLFEMWVRERKPAASTIESWRYVFRELEQHCAARWAGSIMPEEAQTWLKARVTAERSARTVKNTWARATNTVFGWAADQKKIARNPFADASRKITVPKKQKLRETGAFRREERETILRAALAITNTTRPDDAARRWVPWLCAYTGSRPGEITQLRGADVIDSHGVHAIRVTPEAGTVKGGMARVVPLHEHIITQGFLDFVNARGRGPLFYRPAASAPVPDDPTKQKKPRYAQARQRLAAWVRELGVGDPELSPNHAWRHTFKQIGRRAGIAESVLDNICGHAPASVGAAYGAASLEDMAEALRSFPRYDVGPGEPHKA